MVTRATVFRLDNVATRLNKTKYTHLSTIEKTYVKLIEKKRQIEKELADFWRHVKRDEHGRASQSNEWDFYHSLDASETKTRNKIERFMLKHGWNETKAGEVLGSHNQCNMSPGGSF